MSHEFPESGAGPGSGSNRAGAPRKGLVLATLCVALFVAMLDNVVVSNALPSIDRDLDAGVSGLQWVMEGYSLVFAALLLTGGTLGDRYGRRRVFLIGLGIFTAGSVVCALAGSLAALIAGRAVQGVGGALLLPGSMSIIRHVFTDDRERARAIGIWSGVSGAGLALGPAIGGPLVDAFGWASVFWINVPIGVAGIVIGALVLPEFAERRGRFDVPGVLLGVPAVGALVFALIEGPAQGWTSARVLGAGALAVVALVGFVGVELRAAQPMLDVGFLRDRVIGAAVWGGFAVSFGMFGAFFFLGLYLQDVLGYTPTEAGFASFPSTLAIMIAAPISGRVAGRIGPRVPLVVGLTMCGIALGGLSFYGKDVTYLEFCWVLPFLGGGMGLCFTPISIAVMSRVEPARAGMASAVSNTARELGGVVGIAALGAILTARMSSRLGDLLDRANVPPNQARQVVDASTSGGGGGIGHLGSAPPVVREAASTAFIDGLHLALWTGSAVLLGSAVVVAFLMRERPPVDTAAEGRAARTGAAAR
ncbi:MFS transporter [Embleya scabrispora]|uniref:MFS transporter n=1 Tax=Embleya scabrispora TaxID=159449 RepID=A0A1T3NQG8_9ACTN|nr:MFS transporter [Embleya scabrispora]OPC79046.1 MFS transporter [Embleya scabrispora]